MSVFIKYIGICLSVITIIVLVVVIVERNERVKEYERAQKQIQQERISEQYRMSYSFDGDQSQIMDLIKGKAEISMVHPGKSKFTVRVLNSDGTLLTMLADVSGPYDRKQEIDVPRTGAYLLDVRTSGAWSLSTE